MAADDGFDVGGPARIERVRRISTMAEFGRELTELRESANLTVRDAAVAGGLPHTTAGGYFAGTHLPTPKLLATQFRKLLEVLGVDDADEVDAWTAAVAQIRRIARQRTAARSREQPYRGLASFEPQDAPWFFGRAELTQLLLDSALSQRAAGLPLMVVGASGSGKSSVLRAGLIPALPEPDNVALCTPGRDPSGSIDQAVADVSTGADRWIVVDQFEELFTHDVTLTDQRAAIDTLLELAATGRDGERIGVVIGMRADFYAQALAHPSLAPVLQGGQVVVGAMNRDQLRAAIVGPARRVEANIEDGLVELLIEQCAELGRENAGALPLLAHALLATWDKHERGVITTADYLATGGVADAIARSAEDAYNELTAEQQQLARSVFLQLVHVAEGSADTARKVRPDQLPGFADGELPESIAVFVERRLLTADADTLQITHEALLNSWPRLRSWLDAGRADLLAQRRIAAAAEAWQESGRDPDALLRGALLLAAETRLRDPAAGWHPTTLERELLTASTARRHDDERSRQWASRRLRILACALGFLFLLASGTATYAFSQRQSARNATRLADSRAVAEAAVNQRGLDPTVATQLSLAGYRIAQTPEARSALLESADAAQATRAVDGTSLLQALAIAEDRHLLAAVDADGTVRLWNIANPSRPTPIGGPLIHLLNTQLFAGTISPDGRLLAAAGADHVVRLWDIADPAHPIQLPTLSGPTNTVYALAFAPNGSLLAAASADGSVHTWRVDEDRIAGKQQTLLAAGASGYAQSVAFSADGRTLATGTSDGRLVLWAVSPSGTASAPEIHGGLGAAVLGLAFSPEGHTLATGTRNKILQFWRQTGPGHASADGAPLTASTSWINGLSFSPDGTELAAATSADNVELWSTSAHRISVQLPHPEPVVSLAWDSMHTLVTGCGDGALRLWTLPIPQLTASGVINSIRYSPDGKLLAVGSDNLQLWSTASLTPVGVPFGPESAAEALAFSPTAPILAVGYSDGTVRLWDIADSTHPHMVGTPLQSAAPGKTIESLAFGKSGDVLATGADDDTVRLWNTSTLPNSAPTPGQVLTGFNAQVFDVAFSADGRMLAAGSTDKSVQLWRIGDGAHATRLGHRLTGFPGYVYSVAFDPRQPVLAVGIADGTVQLLDITDPDHPTPDGPAITGPSGYLYALEFSPDGTKLAGAVTDDNLWLWDVTDPRAPAALSTLKGSTQALFSVTFSPDSGQLADGGADGVVRLWPTDAAYTAQQLCQTIGDPLGPTDWEKDAPGLPFTPACG